MYRCTDDDEEEEEDNNVGHDDSVDGDDDDVSSVELSVHLLFKTCACQASQIRVLRSNPMLRRLPRMSGP